MGRATDEPRRRWPNRSMDCGGEGYSCWSWQGGWPSAIGSTVRPATVGRAMHSRANRHLSGPTVPPRRRRMPRPGPGHSALLWRRTRRSARVRRSGLVAPLCERHAVLVPVDGHVPAGGLHQGPRQRDGEHDPARRRSGDMDCAGVFVPTGDRLALRFGDGHGRRAARRLHGGLAARPSWRGIRASRSTSSTERCPVPPIGSRRTGSRSISRRTHLPMS